ncbi:hypothetical protein G5V59_04065 [Nocardioides sp. W3-2-3]|uniref:hypothetical protein n=1 Tax=Nocardioides convexus TaxID=2712224 RepID=UPI002418AF99|nr:hypothetical protein [Nocardioides convexus]NGZ99790.1 hypothetical protein [Nocardioides convexus]
MDELVGRGSLSRAEADDQARPAGQHRPCLLPGAAARARHGDRARQRPAGDARRAAGGARGTAGPRRSRVAEVRNRLAGLDATTLHRLRAQEAATRNRKSVLAAIDRRLG